VRTELKPPARQGRGAILRMGPQSIKDDVRSARKSWFGSGVRDSPIVRVCGLSALLPHSSLSVQQGRLLIEEPIRLKYLGDCSMRKGIAAAACLCVAAVAEAEPSPLSGQEMSDLVAGATVEIDAPLGFKVRIRYTRDGQVSGETSTALVLILGAASDTGRWWVEPDQLCHKWKVWFNDYPQCFRMTKDGQTFYWRTFDDKTGTAAIVVPAPPIETAAVAAQPSVPEARATRATQHEGAKPTAPAEAPRPVSKPVARPQAAKPAPEQSAQEKIPAPRAPSSQAPSAQAPSAQAPSSQAPSSQAPRSQADGVPSARTQIAPAPEPAFMVVNVVLGDVLNVRKGPSVDFEVVGGLPPGSRGVTVTGACQLRWCPVQHPSARGWVNTTYLAREAPLGTGADASAARTGPSRRNNR